jgi:hypothetical protein
MRNKESHSSFITDAAWDFSMAIEVIGFNHIYLFENEKISRKVCSS